MCCFEGKPDKSNCNTERAPGKNACFFILRIETNKAKPAGDVKLLSTW